MRIFDPHYRAMCLPNCRRAWSCSFHTTWLEKAGHAQTLRTRSSPQPSTPSHSQGDSTNDQTGKTAARRESTATTPLALLSLKAAAVLSSAHRGSRCLPPRRPPPPPTRCDVAMRASLSTAKATELGTTAISGG